MRNDRIQDANVREKHLNIFHIYAQEKYVH